MLCRTIYIKFFFLGGKEGVSVWIGMAAAPSLNIYLLLILDCVNTNSSKGHWFGNGFFFKWLVFILSEFLTIVLHNLKIYFQFRPIKCKRMSFFFFFKYHNCIIWSVKWIQFTKVQLIQMSIGHYFVLCRNKISLWNYLFDVNILDVG